MCWPACPERTGARQLPLTGKARCVATPAPQPCICLLMPAVPCAAAGAMGGGGRGAARVPVRPPGRGACLAFCCVQSCCLQASACKPGRSLDPTCKAVAVRMRRCVRARRSRSSPAAPDATRLLPGSFLLAAPSTRWRLRWLPPPAAWSTGRRGAPRRRCGCSPRLQARCWRQQAPSFWWRRLWSSPHWTCAGATSSPRQPGPTA